VLVPFPWADSDTALRYAAQRNLTYVVLRAHDGTRRPYLPAWFEDPPAGLQLVKTFTTDNGVTRLYRWTNP
jgi:hypothetical protein